MMARKNSKQVSAINLRHDESIMTTHSRFMHPALVETARLKAEDAIAFKE